MNIENIKQMRIPDVVNETGFHARILYALGIGYGSDPLDTASLPFVYEDILNTVPSYADVLCQPEFWVQDPQYGVDWVNLLHVEQELIIHSPLPASGRFRGRSTVSAIEDKGKRMGALLHQTKDLFNDASGVHLASVRSTMLLRGDGGQGGFGMAPATSLPLPSRSPDRSVHIPTLPQQALIYRLSGDLNPIHIDPEIASNAGFRAPILHGLCTSGISCRALVANYCGDDPGRLKGIFTRFAKPVYPGDTIRFDFFEEGGLVRFRALVEERGDVVISRATACFSGN